MIRCEVMIISGGRGNLPGEKDTQRSGANRGSSRGSAAPDPAADAGTQGPGRDHRGCAGPASAVIGAGLDAAVRPRSSSAKRGFGAGGAADRESLRAQGWPGEDFLTGLDRQRARCGRASQLTPGGRAWRPTTAAGLARRITSGAVARAVEAGLAAVTGRMVSLPAGARGRRRLAGGPVHGRPGYHGCGGSYGRKKRGRGLEPTRAQPGRAGRKVAAWGRDRDRAGRLDLGDGQPMTRVATRAGPACAAAPLACPARGGPGPPPPGRVAPARRTPGYFASRQLARGRSRGEDRIRDRRQGGSRRLWRLAGRPRPTATGTNAIEMDGAPGRGRWTTARTGGPRIPGLLIRRVLLDPGPGLRPTPGHGGAARLHPDQRAPAVPPSWRSSPAIYAYSFIMTNLDVSSPGKAVSRPSTGTVNPHHGWRTSSPATAKLGAALRHLPVPDTPQVNTAWMWGRAARPRTMAAWLHQPHRHSPRRGHIGPRARRVRGRQSHDRHPCAGRLNRRPPAG